jgi:hypothetical protein
MFKDKISVDRFDLICRENKYNTFFYDSSNTTSAINTAFDKYNIVADPAGSFVCFSSHDATLLLKWVKYIKVVRHGNHLTTFDFYSEIITDNLKIRTKIYHIMAINELQT